MSSQEDITLVNLHMQVNKPIIDSPLLMASYVTHLAQVRCSNWSGCCLPFGADAFSTPLFQQNEDGGLVYIGMYCKRALFVIFQLTTIYVISVWTTSFLGCKLVPHFDTYSNWREVRIVSRESNNSTSAHNVSSIAQSLPRSHPWDPNVIIRTTDNVKHTESKFSVAFNNRNYLFWIPLISICRRWLWIYVLPKWYSDTKFNNSSSERPSRNNCHTASLRGSSKV